jgi:hypothetical protein
MNKVIKYINENSIEDMLQAVIESGKDPTKVHNDVRMARVEFQTKTQHFQWALEAYMSKEIAEDERSKNG